MSQQDGGGPEPGRARSVGQGPVDKKTALEAVEIAIARGWALTPLNGKVPRLKNWTKQPRPSPDQMRAWAKAGNVGLRTGSASGVFVIDVDEGGDVSALELPDTTVVETGRGLRHYYFIAPDPCPNNSAGKLGPHIDTRGEGGQVVFPGSIHPDTGKPYRFVNLVDLAPLPPQVLAKLTDRPQAVQGGAAGPAFTSYAAKALSEEVSAVAAAVQGTRNATLNKAAFSLGQLVGGGQLAEAVVRTTLLSAAVGCGLGESEAVATIASGLTHGMTQPRRPRGRPVERREPPARTTPAAPPDDRELPEVVIPGPHQDDQGEYLQVGHHDFVARVMEALPAGALYTRGGLVGELAGEPGRLEFRLMTAGRLRAIIDSHMALVKWQMRRGKNAMPEKLYVPCTEDLAGVVLKSAAHYPLRALEMLVGYPVFYRGPASMGDGTGARPGCGTFVPATPGWNAIAGIYYDCPPEIEALAPITDEKRIQAVLSDLIIDFPFDSDASRHNFFGLLLTPLVRPAIRGNVPLHLIDSSIERAGKSKLVEQVLGRAVLGRPVASMQLSDREEERSKAILSLLIRGGTLIHFDNINAYLDSGALSSLLTSSVVSGRVLGASKDVEAVNTFTVVGTGNKVRLSSELAKRTVPVMLRPGIDHPELRTDFAHPDLDAYLDAHRLEVLAVLTGMVARWCAAGSPRLTEMPLGGFEDWAATVGGILWFSGFTQWRQSDKRWHAQANTEQEELETFVAEWAEKSEQSDEGWTAEQLFNLASDLEIFGHQKIGKSPEIARSRFVRLVLMKMEERPVCGYSVERYGSERRRRWILRKRSG